MLEASVVKPYGNPWGPAPARIRIAIADDHPVLRDGLCRLLSLEDDFEVVVQLDDGVHVADALEKFKPDILLLDLNMPKLDGLSTLQKLRDAGSKTRVIVLTASDDQEDYVRALKLGSCGIVRKETATDLLIDSIRRVHAGELWLDSRTTAAVVQRIISPEEASASEYFEPSRGPAPVHLSLREREIAGLVAQGLSNLDIAEQLSLGRQTIKNRLRAIFDKLGVSDRLEMALYVVEQRIPVGISDPMGR